MQSNRVSEVSAQLLPIPHSKPHISDEDINAVSRVLNSGMIAEGESVKEFEESVARYLGLSGGIATSSGTAALFFALKSLGVGKGDEVILPTYVCRSVMDSVCWTGATPIVCDVSTDWCVNVLTILPHLSKRTKAIVVVHTFGIAADVEEIASLGVPIIEDCAQSLGGSFNHTKLGSTGRFCICSFQATKLLSTGEGGMLLCNDEESLRRTRAAATWGNSSHSFNYRFPMTDIQATLGLTQLGRYENFLKRRRKLADFYFQELASLPVILPHSVSEKSIFYRFPIRVRAEFDIIRAAFDSEGVQVRRGVDTLLHRAVGLDVAKFPGAESCYAETVSIPLYPALSDAMAERVVEASRRVFRQSRG